jgi:hypothetical protein
MIQQSNEDEDEDEEEDEDEDDDEDDDDNIIIAFPAPDDAFTCPRGHWIDYRKDGTVKLSIANTIVALRYMLKDKGIELRYDEWRDQYVIEPPLCNADEASNVASPTPEEIALSQQELTCRSE